MTTGCFKGLFGHGSLISVKYAQQKCNKGQAGKRRWPLLKSAGRTGVGLQRRLHHTATTLALRIATLFPHNIQPRIPPNIPSYPIRTTADVPCSSYRHVTHAHTWSPAVCAHVIGRNLQDLFQRSGCSFVDGHVDF